MSSAREIVARLTLNAQQFSSESAKAFVGLERAAQDAAGRQKSAFEKSFADIQRLAQTARIDAKGITLDVAGAREAAAAAQQQAQALALIEQAARRAAAANNDNSEQTRIYLQAANAATREARDKATALTAEAAALDRLEAELRGVTAATNAFGIAQRQAGMTVQQQRALYQQLGFQIQDVSASLASGISPLVILGQQGGQVASSLTNLTGRAGAAARFFAGPYGAAMLAAGTILATFGMKSDEAGKKQRSLAAEAGSAASILQSTWAGIEKVFDPLILATDRAIDKLEEFGKRGVVRVLKEIQEDLTNILRGVDLLRNAGNSVAGLFGARGTPSNLAGDFQQAVTRDQRRQARQREMDVQDRRFQSIWGFGSSGLEGFMRAPRPMATAETSRVTRVRDDLEKATKQAETLDQLLGRIERTPVYTERAESAQIDALREWEEITTKAEERRAQRQDEAARAMIEAQDRLAERQRQDIQNLATIYEDLFSGNTGSIWRRFKAEGKRAIAEIAAAYTLALISGQKLPALGNVIGALGTGQGVFGAQGGIFGQTIGSGLTGVARLLGIGGKAGASGAIAQAGGFGTAAGWGGAFMPGAGPAAQAGLGGGIGKLLGNDPLRAAVSIGLLAVGPLTRLIAPARRGSATLGFDGGELDVVSSRGNSRSRIQRSTESAGGVADTLRSIAEQLGGQLSGPISTSIGVRNNSFRVDTTGQGRTKLRAGVLDFGQDAAAAAEAAVRDALSDGVISGISAAARNILARGGDLQKAIEQAVSIETIGKRLRAIDDPLGAALDELNKEFETLRRTLIDAGGTAEQLRDAERLYNLEREETVRRVGNQADSLRSFLSELRMGTSSPLSLRDQSAEARARLEPFLAQINAGQAIDTQAYQEAAGRFLDIQRSLFGSTEVFFAEFDRIQAATSRAIERIDNANPIRDAGPFARATAEASATTAEAAQTTVEILAQHTELLATIAERVGLSSSSGGAFIGSQRAFV